MKDFESNQCWVHLHFTFMPLADALIQSDLQCIQAIHFCQYVCFLRIEPTTFCAANAMLYHWATGTHLFEPVWKWLTVENIRHLEK